MHDADYWERAWQAAGGFWRHRGDPRLPHAELTSGKHSDGYANASVVICRPELLVPMCAALHVPLALREAPDRIVGSAYGSIPFAYELASICQCRFGFTERELEGPLKLKRFEVRAGERVLVVTDRATEIRLPWLRETIAAIRATNAELLPVIGTLIDDHCATAIDGFPLVSADASLRFWAAETYSAIRLGTGIGQIDNPTVLERVCTDLRSQMVLPSNPDWVVSCGIEGITLAYQLGKLSGCKAGFTEREMVKASPLTLARFEIKPREKVLVVDDIITTGGTTAGTIAACEAAHADVVGHIAAIADRSESGRLGNREIVALMKLKFDTWEPDACELCQLGSKAIRPKGNWALLTQPYA